MRKREILILLLIVSLIVSSALMSTVLAPAAQKSMTVSYKIVGGGSPTAPTITFVKGSNTTIKTLTATPTVYTMDAGNTYSVSPNPLSTSTSTEQWFSHNGTALSGTVADGTFVFAFYHEYALTVTSAHDSPSPAVGATWYNASTSVTASVSSPANMSGGTRYRCTGWTGTGSVPSSGTSTSVTFTITAVSTVTWNWQTQYQVTFNQTGLDGTATGTVLTVGGVDKTTADLPYTDWFDSGTSFSYTDPVSCSIPGWHFGLTGGVIGPASPIENSGTVIGSYTKIPDLVVPVMPLGTLMAVFSMIATLGGYVGLRRYKFTHGERSSQQA